MKDFKNISIVLAVSVFITVFLYFIDSDPPYPEHWRTVMEFLTMTLVVFGFSTAVYYLTSYIIKSIRNNK